MSVLFLDKLDYSLCGVEVPGYTSTDLNIEISESLKEIIIWGERKDEFGGDSFKSIIKYMPPHIEIKDAKVENGFLTFKIFPIEIRHQKIEIK